VLDYLGAWAERIEANGGICPDNVGPNGIIGETMDGKWWGGYYGWRWPHGLNTVIQPLMISAMNAVLLTGDMSYLDIPRGQLDRLIELGEETEDGVRIPNRYMDNGGWSDYRLMKPEYPIQLWIMSQAEGDRARLDALPRRVAKWERPKGKDGIKLPKRLIKGVTDWNEVLPGRGKGDDIHIAPWYQYVTGENPDYPRKIMEAQFAEVSRRMEMMANDDGDPETWDVHHWQDINPVHTEGLLQLTCGGPQIIYHGGLLHVRLRYFDADARRPGLPPDVGALVDSLDADSLTVTLVNTHPLHGRRLVAQAGAFGEHTFTTATDRSVEGEATTVDVDDKYLSVDLAPGGMVVLELGMKRYSNRPSYEQPV